MEISKQEMELFLPSAGAWKIPETQRKYSIKLFGKYRKLLEYSRKLRHIYTWTCLFLNYFFYQEFPDNHTEKVQSLKKNRLVRILVWCVKPILNITPLYWYDCLFWCYGLWTRAKLEIDSEEPILVLIDFFCTIEPSFQGNIFFMTSWGYAFTKNFLWKKWRFIALHAIECLKTHSILFLLFVFGE